MIMKSKLIVLLVAGTLMMGCTTKKDYVLFNGTNITTPKAKEQIIEINIPSYEYKISAHDRVSITMYNHPEFGTSNAASQQIDTRGVLVTSNGYISLPLVKKVYVAGLTQTAAKNKIEKAFRDFNIEDAEVYVEVLNKRAYITGEVNIPGEVPLFNERLSLLQLLAKAGGMKDTANKHAIVILQKRGKKIYTKTVDLTGTDSLHAANLMIHPNDTVYVTPNDMKPINVGVNEVFGLITPLTNAAVTANVLSK